MSARKITIVLNHTKMVIINALSTEYVKGIQKIYSGAPSRISNKELVNAQNVKNLSERIQAQLVKGFGEFEFSLRDSAHISLLVHHLWANNKRQMLADNSRSGRKLRRNISDISDTFTGAYMDLCPDVKEGTEFRKVLYISRLDANC